MASREPYAFKNDRKIDINQRFDSALKEAGFFVFGYAWPEKEYHHPKSA